MSEATFDKEETGFAFTDEDYTRRYSPNESAASAPASPAAQPAKHTRPQGGGNSVMRARRRRLAASASAST
jgi:hypothetical protein